jgi:hypothetical protein
MPASIPAEAGLEAAMIRWDTALLVLAVSGVGLAGCSSKAALPSKSNVPSKPEQAAPAQHPQRPAKPAGRESALATYSNPEYGVAFRYPRNFALLDDDAGDAAVDDNAAEVEGDLEAGTLQPNSGTRSREELEREEPGAALVATLIVPDDAYPNTSFSGGSVQFAVNRYETAGSCRQSLLSRLGDSNGRSGSATIQGVEFAWADGDAGDGSTEFFERDYAGFSHGACYEFYLRVGVISPDDAGVGRPPDEKKILGHLEKIVASLQFESRVASSLDGPPSAQPLRRKR